VFLLVAPRAGAESGGSTDPDDSAGILDVLSLTHSDTVDKVTLSLALYNSWQPAQTPYYTIAWLFDFDNDGARDDGCLLIEDNNLAFALNKGNCDTGTAPLTPIAAGVASRPNSTSVSVTFDLAKLKEAGQTGNSYKYLVNTFDSASTTITDTAPNVSGPVTHNLTPAVTTGPATSSAATATPSTLEAGTKTTIAGSGFAANAPLKAMLFSDPVQLATFNADAAGKFSAVVTIPLATLPGSHKIVVTGANPAGGNHEATAVLTVVLPRTGGSGTSRTAATGVAVLALGFAVMMLAYYERRVVSVGASRAADAISNAFDRFGL
jgi:hypothetical protein